MKIYNKIVYDINDNIIEEDSYEYEGPLTLADPVSAAVIGGTSLMQYQAQGKIGKYNQAAENRNALVLEGQADQIEQKAEFDIAQFNKTFKKVEGETTVALAKSGVQVGTGSAYNIKLANLFEKQLQEQLISYNAKVASDNKREEANFARIRGTMARQQAKLAQIGTIASAGASLMTVGGGSSFGTKSYNQGVSGSNKRLFTTNSAHR